MKDDEPLRFKSQWLWALFPAFLGVIIVALLAEFKIIEFDFSINDVDTFIILMGLLLTIGLSSILISREAMRQMQRRSDQQALAAFAEERARFLRRLDHEIKNPLMGIRTALDNLAETADFDQRQQIRSAIYEQIDRLTRLVSDLRKIGDLDRREIEQFPVDTITLLQDAFTIATEHDLASSRHLHLDIPHALPAVFGDYDLLLLAIHNVIHNALKYSVEGDDISLSAASADNQIVIRIHDTGPGITAKDLPYVWDELYRSESVKGTSGSGIGLALVKRIIERHNGNVAIESQVDQGTTVSITLPVYVAD